jgi:3-hydroxyacyl-CoA dehydrogenase
MSKNMAFPTINTVGVIGTGVIGASWTALFLARGLKVIVTDPAPGADGKLRDYLLKHWSAIPNAKVTQDQYLNNFKFVKDIDTHLGDIDFIQEVSGPSQKELRVAADRPFNIRMDRRG